MSTHTPEPAPDSLPESDPRSRAASRAEFHGIDADTVREVVDGFERSAWADAWASTLERAREDRDTDSADVDGAGELREFPSLSGVDILEAAPDCPADLAPEFVELARVCVSRVLDKAAPELLAAWADFLRDVDKGAEKLGRYLYLDAVGHGAGLRDLGHDYGRADALHVPREVLGHHETPFLDSRDLEDTHGQRGLPTLAEVLEFVGQRGAHGTERKSPEGRAKAILGALRAWDLGRIKAGRVLELADALAGTFGVERLTLEDESGTRVRYCNSGDTYGTTLAHVADGSGHFRVTSWGDLVERSEHARTVRTGETRCGYCGAWGLGGLSSDGLRYLDARTVSEECGQCGHAAE